VVLRRPEVKAAFDQVAPTIPAPPPVDPAESLRQLSTPAIGLMVASVLHLLFIRIVVPLLLGNVGPLRGMFVPAAPGSIGLPIWAGQATVLTVIVLLLLPPLLTFVGAWRMRRLRGRGYAMAAAIL